MADCYKTHQSERTIEGVSYLRESQKSYWRHKCAACAYEKGFEDGMKEGRAQLQREMKKAKESS